MKDFPDESRMEKSAESGDPIRGGSIGFNRIFNYFVDAARNDNRPRFKGIMISAFTIIRNIWSMNSNASLEEYEQAFVRDVELFCEYFDIYLSKVWHHPKGGSFIPIIIYFPDYRHLPKDMRRDHGGKQAILYDQYQKFLNHHGDQNQQVKNLEHSRCFFIGVGKSDYPHKELTHKFREITHHRQCFYTSGDSICLITSNPLDLYLAARLRGVMLLESYTASLKKPEDFRFKLDKEGRVPFVPVIHGILGDGFLVKSEISPKVKKAILETAVTDRWLGRSEDDLRQRVGKITGISPADLRRYNFG